MERFEFENTATEKRLADIGVDYEYMPSVPLIGIDTASEHSQVRLHKDDDQTITYAERMAEGTRFPAVVLHKAGRKGKLVIWDGYHRLDALQLLDRDTVDAYVVVNATEQQEWAYLVESNADHGLPITRAERVEGAMQLIAHGASHTKAAKMAGVPLSAVQAQTQRHQARARLARMNVSSATINSLMDTHLKRLGGLSSDPVMRAATDLVVESKMDTNKVSELVTKLNTLPSESRQLAYIADVRATEEAIAKTTAKDRFQLPWEVRRLDRYLEWLNELAPSAITEARLSYAHRKRMEKKLVGAYKTLSVILEGLQAPISKATA